MRSPSLLTAVRRIIDWTPEGSEAKSRNLYPTFLQFVKDSIQQLKDRGHEVELAGIFYHVGENDMSWDHFEKDRPNELCRWSRRCVRI